MTIGVVGLGYVGLTLTAALARKGYIVHGVDVPAGRARRRCRAAGRTSSSPASRRSSPSTSARASSSAPTLPPDGVDVAVICVSTPVDEHTRRPNLANLAAAARDVAAALRAGHAGRRAQHRAGRHQPPGRAAGAARGVGRRRQAGDGARAHHPGPGAARAGRAAAGVGGLDEASLRRRRRRSSAAWPGSVVPVSGLEAAELVKLSNNCHTDLIYSFGNEIALIAERHGLDPLEVIRRGQPRLSAARTWPSPATSAAAACPRTRTSCSTAPATASRSWSAGPASSTSTCRCTWPRRSCDLLRASRGRPRGRAAGGARLGLQGLAAHRRHARHADRRR